MAKDSPSDDPEESTPDEGDVSSEASEAEPTDAAPSESEVENTEVEGTVSEDEGTTAEDPEAESPESAEPAREGSKGKREFRWPALRRSADDRLVAGVAGGLGDFFGIDPVIVRIGFIVLTFFGGVGPALYLASWLIVPLGDSGSILANALRSGASRRFRNLAGIVLIAFGLFVTAVLSRNVFEVFAKVSSTAPYLALALIVAGIGLVFWPRRSAPPLDTPAEPLAAPTATVPSPPSAAGSEWPGATLPEETKETRRDRRAERRSQRRGQSTVTFLTLAALLVLTGGAILLDRLDVERVLLGEFFAVALLVVAMGLLVSVFIGRNWTLIVLGVVLFAPLVVFSGSDVSWWSGYGDVKAVPEDISSLDHDINHGIGDLVVDLRYLDSDTLRSSEASAIGRHNLGLTVGDVTIIVPADLRVRTNVNVGAGRLRSGEYVILKQVMVPRIEDGQLYCVDAQYAYRVDDEIPDFRRERALCGDGLHSGTSWWVDYDLVGRGANLTAVHNTHGESAGEYDLEFNVDVGVGQVRVVRFPARN